MENPIADRSRFGFWKKLLDKRRLKKYKNIPFIEALTKAEFQK
jgi:hypothetical protein